MTAVRLKLSTRERNYSLGGVIPGVHSQKRASCSKSAISKPISGWVRIACSGLMITSLLQVVKRVAARANCMQA